MSTVDRKDQFIVACIPAYCEERTIARVILSAQKYVDKVLVCDDGSVDMTGEIAEKLGATVDRHDGNRGKGHALKTLFRMAMKHDADIMVLIDGDGQHNPNEIPNLIEPILQSKADLVLGSRFVDDTRIEAPLHRRVGLRILNYLHRKVNGLLVTDAECGFRAFSRKALEAVCYFDDGGYGADAEMVSLARNNGINIVEIPITVKYEGLEKTSKKTPLIHGGALVTNLLRVVIEERPLMCLGVPGALLLILGMSTAIYTGLSFNSTGVLSLYGMLVTMGSIVVGLLLLVTSFITWILQKISARINDLTLNNNARAWKNTTHKTK